MALFPPPNGAGIPVPQHPADPPTLNDIANAVSYVSQLTETHGKSAITLWDYGIDGNRSLPSLSHHRHS